MFCSKCGTEIKENWKVCPNCGKKMEALKEEESIPISNDSIHITENKEQGEKTNFNIEKRKLNIRRIIKVLAIVAFVCYFCPLYMVSCAGQEVCSISGSDLTFGFQAMGEDIDGNWVYGIIAVLPLLWFGAYSYKSGEKDEAPYSGSACSGGLLILMIYISSMLEETAASGGMLVITSCTALIVLKAACFFSTGMGGYLVFLEEIGYKSKETLDVVWVAVKCIGKIIGLSILTAALVLGVMQYFSTDEYEELMQDKDSYDYSDETKEDLETLDDIEESQNIEQKKTEKEEIENTSQDIPEQTIQESSKEETEFIFPNSDSQYLLVDELIELPVETLRIGRNEIFARHGYIFKDENLQKYFNNTSWYEGTVKGEDFNMEEEFNKYEKENVELIKSIEEGMN